MTTTNEKPIYQQLDIELIITFTFQENGNQEVPHIIRELLKNVCLRKQAA